MANIIQRMGGGALAAVLLFSFFACQSEQASDPRKSLIKAKTESLFTRIKVRDYAVIYENEYPYMKEEADLQEYLANRYMQWYKPDTLMAIQVDSVVIRGDSALAHMRLEWLASDSSLILQTIRLPWVYVDDEWLKPTLSRLDMQLEFEEELRVYWEAVREMEQRQQEQERQDSSGRGDQ